MALTYPFVLPVGMLWAYDTLDELLLALQGRTSRALWSSAATSLRLGQHKYILSLSLSVCCPNLLPQSPRLHRKPVTDRRDSYPTHHPNASANNPACLVAVSLTEPTSQPAARQHNKSTGALATCGRPVDRSTHPCASHTYISPEGVVRELHSAGMNT